MLIRIATQNIWGRVPLWNLRKRAIARSLRHADVVVLQEVQGRRKGSSQAHELAREMGLGYVHFASAGKTLGWREGVGIISRFPITHVAWEKLAQTRHLIDRMAPRPVLRVVVETPAGLLEVYGLHLSLAKEARTRVAGDIVAFARRQREEVPAKFAAIAGDFNATSGEACVGELQRGCGVVDVHAGVGRTGATFPAVWPQRRIDYVMLSPNLKPVRVERRKSLGSDHCGVVVQVEAA